MQKWNKSALRLECCKVHCDNKGFQCSQRCYSSSKDSFNLPFRSVACGDNIRQNTMLLLPIMSPSPSHCLPSLTQMAQKSRVNNKHRQWNTKRQFYCAIILKPEGWEEMKGSCLVSDTDQDPCWPAGLEHGLRGCQPLSARSQGSACRVAITHRRVPRNGRGGKRQLEFHQSRAGVRRGLFRQQAPWLRIPLSALWAAAALGSPRGCSGVTQSMKYEYGKQ